MASSAAAIVPLSQLSFLFQTKPNTKTSISYLHSRPSKPRTSRPTRLHCQKMYVPGGFYSPPQSCFCLVFYYMQKWNNWLVFNNAGFGEASPEAKAAQNLHNFFTYIAVRIVAAQLEVTDSKNYPNTSFLLIVSIC